MFRTDFFIIPKIIEVVFRGPTKQNRKSIFFCFFLISQKLAITIKILGQDKLNL